MKAGLATDGWKRTPEHYLNSAEYVLGSIERHGFYNDEPIPIDRDGELLGGAHRLACAYALGIKEVPIVQRNQEVWAPPWPREWFVEHGMPVDDLILLDEDMCRMQSG
jgi:hypothetical protein